MSELKFQTHEALWRIKTAFSVLRHGADAPLVNRYRILLENLHLDNDLSRRRVMELKARVKENESRFARALAVLESDADDT